MFNSMAYIYYCTAKKSYICIFKRIIRMGDNKKSTAKKFFSFLMSKTFFKHLALIILFYILIGFGILLWLNAYTNHGQKLTLPDYNGIHVEKAMADAVKRHFKVIIDDSTFIVGKPGGIIVNQNPKAGAKVKENRKIYVTVTKYNPDKIKIENLPSLYGRSYEVKKRELAQLDINTKIKGYEYDKGAPNYILKVYYKGKEIISKEGKAKGVEIEKGGTLEFILSRKTGGITNLPDLRCKSVEEAIFLIETRRLKTGKIIKDGTQVNGTPAGYVVKQIPPATAELPMDTQVDLYISDELPADCR